MAQTTRFAAISGMAAALSMAATPVAAADLPIAAPKAPVATYGVFDKDAVNAERHRRYRHYRHRHRVDAGDVIAGVLIIGGIAAIASAASKNSRNERYRDRDYRYRDRDYRNRDYRYQERRGDSRYSGGRGIDNAVERCISRIERDVRVDSVDSVDRTGEGWRVAGSLYNGDRFTCRIGSDGRVEDIDYGGLAASQPVEDNQWSDDRYRAAWNDLDSGKLSAPQQAQPVQAQGTQAQPAYPGGPLPGEEVDGDLAQDDRYTMAEAPNPGG